MEMHDHEKSHKEKFQLERIALFSDAIFAIAITLLIIEIKVPELPKGHVTDRELGMSLIEMIPKFVGFFLSFFVIGLYWHAHHRLFRYVVRSSQKLLWANLLFMLPIVIMPFSTVFFSEYYNGALRVPLLVYMINISFSGLLSLRLWNIVGNPENHLTAGLDRVVLNYNRARAIFIPCIFIFTFCLSFISPWLSYLIPPFTPLGTKLIKNYYGKKYPALAKNGFE